MKEELKITDKDFERILNRCSVRVNIPDRIKIADGNDLTCKEIIDILEGLGYDNPRRVVENYIEEKAVKERSKRVVLLEVVDGWCEYIGRVTRRESFFPIKDNYLPFQGDVYHLEVENTNNGKVKRKRLGTNYYEAETCTFSDIKTNDLRFTDRGLEVTVLDERYYLNKPKIVLISRKKFPKSKRFFLF